MDEVQRLIVDALQLETEQSIGRFLLVNSVWKDYILQKASPVHTFLANRQRKTSYVHVNTFSCPDSDCGCSSNCEDVDVQLETIEDWDGVEANLFGIPVRFLRGLNEIECDLDYVILPIQAIRSIIELAGKLGLDVYVHVSCFETCRVLNTEFPGLFREALSGWDNLLEYHPAVCAQ